MSGAGPNISYCLTCAHLVNFYPTQWGFTPPWEFYPQSRNTITIANTNIFVGRNIPPPRICTPKNYPPPNMFWFEWFVQILLFGKSWCLLFDLNFKICTPGVKFFEFDNKYIIRCLLLKYRLIFLLVFLYLTRLKAHQILSRLVKNISLYFKRRHLIIYNYFVSVMLTIWTILDLWFEFYCFCQLFFTLNMHLNQNLFEVLLQTL